MNVRALSRENQGGWTRAIGLSFHTGFASALCVSGFQPLLSRLVVGRVDLHATASLYAAVWIAYLIDRLPSHPEDHHAVAANHSAQEARRSPFLFRGLLVALGCFEVALLVRDTALMGAVTIAVVVSLLYSAPLPLLRVRAKAVPYFKAVYLATGSVVTIIAFTPQLLRRGSPHAALLLVATFCLYLLAYSLFDIKDIEGDRRAGIKTIAAAMGPHALLRAQIAAAIVVALGLVLTLGAPLAWPLAGVAVFHALFCLRLFRRPLTPTLCAIFDLGYGVILAVGAAVARPQL